MSLLISESPSPGFKPHIGRMISALLWDRLDNPHSPFQLYNSTLVMVGGVRGKISWSSLLQKKLELAAQFLPKCKLDQYVDKAQVIRCTRYMRDIDA